MKCPYCGHQEDKVLDSRGVSDGEAIKRRRECLACARRYTTYEHIEDLQLMVVKKDQRREPFDRSKVLRGIVVACEKRPISMETLERVTDDIERALYDSGRKEVTSFEIGDMVIDALRHLDQIAYVRFASVYRRFEDVSQFSELIDFLAKASKRRPARRVSKLR